MKNCKMYCLCINNKDLKIIQNLDYIPVGLGADKFSNEWLTDKTLDNISHKNSFYGEYTFHYWFWKNLLPKIEENEWIGFCAYRDYWAKEKIEILEKNKFINQERLEDLNQINNLVLKEIPESWHKYDTIIGEPLHLDYPLKISKILKHGIKSIIRNPNAIFRKGRTIRFQFDMFHGNGVLDRAIDLLDIKERNDFKDFTRSSTSFNRGNMFVCKSRETIKKYYESIFPWLLECEKIFGFNLTGYGKIRIYAFLAERYLSYWFSKYTNPLLWPVIHFDSLHKK
jgi:hypothetical protein